MKLIKEIALLLILASLFHSCIKDTNPPLPAYVKVDSISFSVAADGSEGTGSYNIKDVWISVDGQQLGVNNLPYVSFPVILDTNYSTNSIKISAGIEENGIANTRRIYPFYKPYTTTANLVAGETTVFSPALRYDTAAIIRIIEDFEPNGTVFSEDKDGNAATFMARQSTEVFEGNYSGQIILDSANLECEVATAIKYSNLQPAATSFPVYLEMDYKTNNSFSVGIVAHYGSSTQITYIAGVNKSDDWNKIYFNLTTAVFSADADQYSIIIRALKNVTVLDPKIYIDNIKLVHY